MIVKDYYIESLKHEFYSLQILIEFLVYEKKVLKLTDSEDKLTFFLQDKFRKSLNQHLVNFKEDSQGGFNHVENC
jgi:hypothetical protein